MLEPIRLRPGASRRSGLLSSSFLLATDASGNGIDGTPLAGMVYRRRANDPRGTWFDGVRATVLADGQIRAAGHLYDGTDPVDGGKTSGTADGSWGDGNTPGDHDANQPTIAEVDFDGTISADTADRWKVAPVAPSTRIFRSFTIYYPAEVCETDPEMFVEDTASAGLDAWAEALLRHELETGYHTGNPSLRSEASSVGGDAEAAISAVETLLDAWALDGAVGAPVLSGRAGAVARIGSEWGSSIDPYAIPLHGGIGGVQPGAAAPHEPFTDPASGSAAESSLYLHGGGFFALGPVEYPKNEEGRADMSEVYRYFDARQNEKRIVAERRALVVWHPGVCFEKRVANSDL